MITPRPLEPDHLEGLSDVTIASMGRIRLANDFQDPKLILMPSVPRVDFQHGMVMTPVAWC